MCFGKPDSPPPPAQEIAMAEAALQDQRMFEEVFLPQEIEAIRAADDPRQEALDRIQLRAMANADVNQAGRANIEAGRGVAGMTGFGGGQAKMALSGAGDSVALAESSALTGADLEAQRRTDLRRINVANTGQGLRSQQMLQLSQGAQRSNARAISKLERDAMMQGAKMRAAGDLAGAAITYRASKHKPQAPDGKNMTVTAQRKPGDFASVHGY